MHAVVLGPMIRDTTTVLVKGFIARPVLTTIAIPGLTTIRRTCAVVDDSN